VVLRFPLKMINPSDGIRNFLTVDVEDYFHVHVFSKVIKVGQWGQYDIRVEENTRKILDLLSAHDIKATFFILGWVAEKAPDLVKAIHRMGHEVASHGYWHKVIYGQTPSEFREDIKRSKSLLEDLIGEAILGYRAPTYSITRETLWALSIIREEGFRYDSSVFPIHHDNYGIPDAPRSPFLWDLKSCKPKAVAIKSSSEDCRETVRKKWSAFPADLLEFPISTVAIGSINLPIGGGGYFRFLPYGATRMGLAHINKKDRMPFVFYIHPWEVDPNQPVIGNISRMAKFRHYNNLLSCFSKLDRLMSDFQFGTIGNFLTRK